MAGKSHLALLAVARQLVPLVQSELPLLGRYDADYEAVLMPASAFTDTEIAFR